MTTERDPYAVLGVMGDATPGQVTAAHRALARRYHPDVSRAPDAERRMAEINAAWRTLSDPDRRAAWDLAHGVRPQRVAPPEPTDRAPAVGPAPAPFGRTRSGAAPAAGAHPAWRRGENGEGAAGPPPGGARGSVLPFGRHIGWSLGEIARVDPGYLAWLLDRREGAPYRVEITALLAAMRSKVGDRDPRPAPRRRLFR